jgi:hypothetical protein
MREMRGSTGYTHSEARKVLRRFSSQLIHLLAKWDAAPDPSLGISLPMARDLVFGGLEHIVWTALVQGRLEDLDVPKLSRDLAGAYMRALALSDRGAARGRRKQRRRRAVGTRHATKHQ